MSFIPVLKDTTSGHLCSHIVVYVPRNKLTMFEHKLNNLVRLLSHDWKSLYNYTSLTTVNPRLRRRIILTQLELIVGVRLRVEI